MNADVLLEHFHRLGDAPEGVPRLRRFILELAMRGKLVVQDRNEEPATVLLARIDAQVTKAVKAGKHRKQVENVELDVVPYELPRGWQWVHFGRLAEFSAGRTPSRNDLSFWNTGDYPWVSIADLIDDGEVVETKETVSKKAKSLFGGEPSAMGTMIMSFKLTIGKISRLGVAAYHNEAIVSIYPHELELDGYLFKVLPECARVGKTKAAIKGATLNRESIHNILIPLPPLPEQQRIVAKVDELMAQCDRLEAAQQEREQRRTRLTAACWRALTSESDPNAARFALEQLPALTTRPQQIAALRQTILDLAVRGRLVKQDEKDEPAEGLLKRLLREHKARWISLQEAKYTASGAKPPKDWQQKYKQPAHEEGLFELPDTWRWASAAEACERVENGHTPLPHEMQQGSGEVPYIKVYNLTRNGRLDFTVNPTFISQAVHEKTLSRSRILPGDVLMNIVGPPIGKVSIVPNDYPEWNTNQAVVLFRPSNGLLSSYLATCLLADSVLHWIARTAQKTVGQSNVSVTNSRLLPIPLPPLAEQRRIVAKVDELMRLCDALEAALVRGEAVKGRLLEAVLAGGVEPKKYEEPKGEVRMAAEP